jgi:hypothetical protein
MEYKLDFTQISLGDIIGYLITFIVGFFSGNIYKNYKVKKTIQRDIKAGGDFVGGNKIG